VMNSSILRAVCCLYLTENAEFELSSASEERRLGDDTESRKRPTSDNRQQNFHFAVMMSALNVGGPSIQPSEARKLSIATTVS
jgi:hypothetical protein